MVGLRMVVLYIGCFELLSRMSKLNIQDEVLDKINGMIYILYYCYGDNFSDDALVFISPNRMSTSVEETNLLQESWKDPEMKVMFTATNMPRSLVWICLTLMIC
jgi:hypothetical protein